MGAANGDAKAHAGLDVGGRGHAPDVRGAAGREAAVEPLGAAQTELEHRVATGRLATIRAALVAISVWKLMTLSRAVSSS